jgi:hypothetical protein
MPPPVWSRCPKCHQLAGLPAPTDRHAVECDDCGHVWKRGDQPSPSDVASSLNPSAPRLSRKP